LEHWDTVYLHRVEVPAMKTAMFLAGERFNEGRRVYLEWGNLVVGFRPEDVITVFGVGGEPGEIHHVTVRVGDELAGVIADPVRTTGPVSFSFFVFCRLEDGRFSILCVVAIAGSAQVD
jgi:hypothetical protein